MFDRPRRWREEDLTWAIMGYLKGVFQMDRRAMRYRFSAQQPQGVRQITWMSRRVKKAVQDLSRAGMIQEVPSLRQANGGPYLFVPPSYTMTEKGKALMAQEPRPPLPDF